MQQPNNKAHRAYNFVVFGTSCLVFYLIFVVSREGSTFETEFKIQPGDKLDQEPKLDSIKENCNREQCSCTSKNGVVDMCYRPFIDKNLTIREEGIPFACQLADLIPPEDSLELPKNNLKFEDLVLVTYGSASFFKQLKTIIPSWQPLLEKNQMVVFDMGLTEEQKSELEQMQGISVRKLDFSIYPPHVAILGQSVYAFKGAVVLEAYKVFKFFLFMDSSIRLVNEEVLREYVDAVLKGTFPPLSLSLSSSIPSTQLTHFGVYKYLPIRKGLNDRVQKAAGLVLVKRSKFAYDIVRWYSLCAFTKHCIAPLGSFQKCPKVGGVPKPICHRFDQSAMNIIVRNKLLEAPGNWSNVYEKNYYHNAFIIKRDTRRYKDTKNDQQLNVTRTP